MAGDRKRQQDSPPDSDALQEALEVYERLDHKLKAVSEKYRHMIELLAEVMYERYVEEDVFVWDEETLARLGYSAESFGVAWEDFLRHLHPDDRSRVDREIAAAVSRGGSYDVEYRLLDATGTYRWMRDRAILRQDQEGTTVFGVLNDITDTRVRERDIETLNHIMREKASQLETANRELESFSYSVSHDLRAPLRAISSFVEILNEDYREQLDAEGQHYLQIISSNVEQMNALIRDLLAFSRLTRQPLTKDQVDMTALAQEAFDQLRPEEQRIVWKLDPLPEAYGDVRMLKQVWMNLISNALKYSRNEDPPEISVTARTADGRTVYTVADNGVGFDQEYQEKLFAVFQRLHADKSFEGTGVGLSIVQRIIQRHSGRIWAEGRPGEGASFSFYLA